MPEELFHEFTLIIPENQIYLERPGIYNLLENMALRPVIFILAGAGYGKTCTVYSFVKTNKIRTAWIQCSVDDNTEENFWKKHVFSMSIISRETKEKLSKMKYPAAEMQFNQYLKILKSYIIPTEKYFFIYDDLHHITSGSILHFLEKSITISLPNVTHVLISRTMPPLKTVCSEEKNLKAMISSDHLCFNQNEIASFFRLLRIKTTPETIPSIYHDTGGWPFAVHLAGLSIKNITGRASYDPKALRLNIFKLIESEIMGSLSPDLRRFLIKLSLIKNHELQLLEEIENDASIIKKLNGILSFVRFDSRRNAYYFNCLFMDYLKEAQGELDEKEKRKVWKKTALWYRANNLNLEAIGYFEKTADYKNILKTLRSFPLLLSTQTAKIISGTLDRFPKEIYGTYPEIIEMRSRILNSLGNFEQSKKEILSLLPKLLNSNDSSEKYRILTICYLNLGFIGLLESIYNKHYDFIDYFRQAGIFRKKAKINTDSPTNGIIMSSYACRVSAPAEEKDIEKYIAVIKEIVPYTMDALGGCQSGMYELTLGEYSFFKGQIAEAEKYLHCSLEKAKEKQQFEVENRSLFYLLRIYIGKGSREELENVLVQLEAEQKEVSFLNRQFYHAIVTGWYYIQTDRKENISPWIKNDYGESELNSRTRGLEKLVKAKYLFSENRHPAALAVIENQGGAEPIVFGAIEMKALEAICLYRLKDKKGAYMALAAAYTLAAPALLFMPFAELGKDMRALAEAAKKDKAKGLPLTWLNETYRNSAAYAKKLYSLKTKPCEDGIFILSERERDVLVSLSQGLTRQEIAGASSISPNTVKSVTRSIYNKLGALNRAVAVRIASERGIL